jgi:L-amino acid N-acyltransferase YncA
LTTLITLDNNDNLDNHRKYPDMTISIRPARPDDAPAILEIYAPYVLNTPVSFEEVVPSSEEIVSRMEIILQQYPYLVCEIDGKIAGYAYASVHRTRASYRWTCESSVYVAPEFHRMKIGKALDFCLIECLRYQGIKLVLAGITVPNAESVGFHENFGFVKAAEYHATGFKLGKWHNVGWWELDLNPERKDPSAHVIPFQEILESRLADIFKKGIDLISL